MKTQNNHLVIAVVEIHGNQEIDEVRLAGFCCGSSSSSAVSSVLPAEVMHAEQDETAVAGA